MFLRGGSNSILLCLMMAFVVVLQMNVVDAFIKQKKQYTPLIFFKVPAGTMAECKYL
jgi:hypothetical protein